MQITGGCHCGEVTYHAEVDENKVINCHGDITATFNQNARQPANHDIGKK